MLCRSREKEKDSEEIAWERTRETVSRSMPLKGNIMVPRNKTKLAHCLIICVTVMVWPSPSSSLSRGAFVHLRFSAALFLFEVFILIIIFLYFSRCLSYSCYYYLLAIIDTMSILLLFVSMWLPPPPPPLPLSPSLIVRIADDICVHHFFLSLPVIMSSLVLPSYQFSSRLSCFIWQVLSGEQAKRGKGTAKNRFVISFSCGRFALYSSSSVCLRSIRFDDTHTLTHSSCQTEDVDENP